MELEDAVNANAILRLIRDHDWDGVERLVEAGERLPQHEINSGLAHFLNTENVEGFKFLWNRSGKGSGGFYWGDKSPLWWMGVNMRANSPGYMSFLHELLVLFTSGEFTRINWTVKNPASSLSDPERGWRLIHHACDKVRLDLVEKLLSFRADPNGCPSREALKGVNMPAHPHLSSTMVRTPAQVAAERGSVEIVDRLEAAGADLGQCGIADARHPWTVLSGQILSNPNSPPSAVRRALRERAARGLETRSPIFEPRPFDAFISFAEAPSSSALPALAERLRALGSALAGAGRFDLLFNRPAAKLRAACLAGDWPRVAQILSDHPEAAFRGATLPMAAFACAFGSFETGDAAPAWIDRAAACAESLRAAGLAVACSRPCPAFGASPLHLACALSEGRLQSLFVELSLDAGASPSPESPIDWALLHGGLSEESLGVLRSRIDGASALAPALAHSLAKALAVGRYPEALALAEAGVDPRRAFSGNRSARALADEAFAKIDALEPSDADALRGILAVFESGDILASLPRSSNPLSSATGRPRCGSL